MLPITINKQKRKFLLALPAVVLPFVCLVFYTLGGGRGIKLPAGRPAMGLNTELPGSNVAPKALLDKKRLYEQAEHDSIRKAQYQRQDPYRRDTTRLVEGKPAGPALTVRPLEPPRKAAGGELPVDPKAEQLLQELDQLKRAMHQPQPSSSTSAIRYPRGYPSPRDRHSDEDTVNDPKVNQLNAMLDKVIRIQHPEEGGTGKAELPGRAADVVLPADTSVNAISAIIPEDQTLTAGTTIALRITDSIRVNGRTLGAGQLVYGVVNINNDRLLIHVTALREDRNLFTTELQIYDLDGLAGIHIPGVLSRDVAKQSADQGVNSLNILNTDPTLGAQAASAGIQTAKTFLSHKVRQVRVSVRAGYQVLLRNTHDKAISHSVIASGAKPEANRLPGFAPGGSILKHCRTEGVELALRTIGLDSGRLWFGLEWTNHSPILYLPAYVCWYVRDRRVFRRTAMQELPMEPLAGSKLQVVLADSIQYSWTGFTSFAIAKDKELVVEVGEKNGGRTLSLVIDHKLILNAKTIRP